MSIGIGSVASAHDRGHPPDHELDALSASFGSAPGP
jgi:hypothetical protein